MINGIFKLIRIQREGVTSNGSHYINVLAVDFFGQKKEGEDDNKKADFYMLKAYGSTADFVKRNCTGTRRAFVIGELQVEHYKDTMEVEKKLIFNGQSGHIKFNVEVEKTSLSINVSSIRFLDKPNETSDIQFQADNANSDEVEFTPDNSSSTSTDKSTDTKGNFEVNVDGKQEPKGRKSSLAGR